MYVMPSCVRMPRLDALCCQVYTYGSGFHLRPMQGEYVVILRASLRFNFTRVKRPMVACIMSRAGLCAWPGYLTYVCLWRVKKCTVILCTYVRTYLHAKSTLRRHLQMQMCCVTLSSVSPRPVFMYVHKMYGPGSCLYRSLMVKVSVAYVGSWLHISSILPLHSTSLIVRAERVVQCKGIDDQLYVHIRTYMYTLYLLICYLWFVAAATHIHHVQPMGATLDLIALSAQQNRLTVSFYCERNDMKIGGDG